MSPRAAATTPRLGGAHPERRYMAQCVTCGSELHPDRAKKYNYCMKPECQEKNLKALTLVAVGVNKSAEQYLLLDEQTQNELASGKFADQRRGSFGTSVPTSGPSDAAAGPGTAARPARPHRRPRHRCAPGPAPARPAPAGTPPPAGHPGPPQPVDQIP